MQSEHVWTHNRWVSSNNLLTRATSDDYKEDSSLSQPRDDPPPRIVRRFVAVEISEPILKSNKSSTLFQI